MCMAREVPNKVKLHLGCFKRKIYGFINVDIRDDVEPDVVDDITKLQKFEDNSVDLIFTSHTLEHVKREEVHKTLGRWYEVLKPGGKLFVSVPDMQAVCEHYIYNKDIWLLRNFIWGSQKHDYDYHYVGWDFKSLYDDLLSVGFVGIERYNWQEQEWFYIDSYEQAYLPHLHKISGRLMSLNISCQKSLGLDLCK